MSDKSDGNEPSNRQREVAVTKTEGCQYSSRTMVVAVCELLSLAEGNPGCDSR